MEIEKRELYNFIVEEDFNGGYKVIKDSKYLKIKLPDKVRWPLLDKYNLKYHLAQKNIELKISFLDDKSVKSDWLICKWGFEEFCSDFGPIRDRIELPAAITNLIFLGSINHITTENIRDLNIKYILSAGAKIPEKVQIGNDTKVIYFDVADEKNQVLDFEATTKVISEAVNKSERVLVHCHKGVSRSSSIVLAYLISKSGLGMTMSEASGLVKSSRQVAKPNLGFIKQLYRWEVKHHGVESSDSF